MGEREIHNFFPNIEKDFLLFLFLFRRLRFIHMSLVVFQLPLPFQMSGYKLE